MRVRIMHVFIRRRLINHPEWDLEAWGVPISIADATLTLMGGSVVPGLALWSVGHQTTISEIEALLHFWRYVGHLLGVQPDWYPRDFEQSVQLMYAAFVKRAYTAGADGEELVESYLPAFAPKPGTPTAKADPRRAQLPRPDRLHALLDAARSPTAGTRCRTRGRGRCIR